MAKLHEEAKIKGNFHFFNLPAHITEHSPELQRVREAARNNDMRAIRQLKEDGLILDHLNKHNLVTTRGRTVLAGILAGDTTYTGIINYGALGSSSTAVNNADTQLGTEVYRKLYASHTYSSNVAYVDFFYAATDTSGTYNEFGNFIDGTGTANSGRIFSHILTGGWVKSGVASLFVTCQYTLT